MNILELKRAQLQPLEKISILKAIYLFINGFSRFKNSYSEDIFPSFVRKC